MPIAISVLPDQQLAALNDAYRRTVARKRQRSIVAAAAVMIVLVVAAFGADVDLLVLAAKIGNFTSYFDRILKLDSGARVWTDIGEWFWGWRNWLALLGETILISYVGTLAGAVCAFALNFLAAENTAPSPWLRFAVRRVMELEPDLVLLDLQLPGINGLEDTRRVKARPRAPAIIMVTADDTPECRAAARAAGTDAFIGKQHMFARLPGAIRKCFPKRDTVTPEPASAVFAE